MTVLVRWRVSEDGKKNKSPIRPQLPATSNRYRQKIRLTGVWLLFEPTAQKESANSQVLSSTVRCERLLPSTYVYELSVHTAAWYLRA